jgi:hypothetical protein
MSAVPRAEIAGGTDGLWTLPWRELDSNPRSPGYGGDEVALRGSDCREAAAIFTARDA